MYPEDAKENLWIIWGCTGLSGIPFLEDNYPQVPIKSIDLGLRTIYFA
jgi:hypothetical protein